MVLLGCYTVMWLSWRILLTKFITKVLTTFVPKYNLQRLKHDKVYLYWELPQVLMFIWAKEGNGGNWAETPAGRPPTSPTWPRHRSMRRKHTSKQYQPRVCCWYLRRNWKDVATDWRACLPVQTASVHASPSWTAIKRESGTFTWKTAWSVRGARLARLGQDAWPATGPAQTHLLDLVAYVGCTPEPPWSCYKRQCTPHSLLHNSKGEEETLELEIVAVVE